MGDSTGVLPPSFQPWTDRSTSSQKSFASVLSRIYQERGPFRNITEAALRDEFTTQAITGASSPEGSEAGSPIATAQDSSQDDVESRTKRLQTARQTVLAHVASAQNEALLALDFVSLLLSKDMKSAETTMSPHLKENVPSGTLGMDMWAGMEPDVKVEETNRLLARGKRMQALGESADALLKAGDRLKNTVERERKYWDEVLKVEEDGWSVCRVPRERGTLGVRYGFGEAQGEFKSRGLAALRMSDDGGIVLDRGLGKDGQSLRIRVKRDQEIIGESSTKRLNEESLGIGNRIKIARDSLFEEELWHEAMKESRELGAYGVRLRGNTIVIPSAYTGEQLAPSVSGETIEVDAIPHSHDSGHHQPSLLSNVAAAALRLLLCNAHRERLKERSQVPRPLSSTKVTKDAAQILRPLMSLLQYRGATSNLRAALTSLSALLTESGISSSVSRPDPFASLLAPASSATDLFDRLTSPLSSAAILSIDTPISQSAAEGAASGRTELSISTTTAFAPPYYGTRFALSCDDNTEFAGSSASLEGLLRHLAFVVTGVLTTAAAGKFTGWDADWRTGRLMKPLGMGSSRGDRLVTVAVEHSAAGDQREPQWRLQLNFGSQKRGWVANKVTKEFWASVGEVVNMAA